MKLTRLGLYKITARSKADPNTRIDVRFAARPHAAAPDLFEAYCQETGYNADDWEIRCIEFSGVLYVEPANGG